MMSNKLILSVVLGFLALSVTGNIFFTGQKRTLQKNIENELLRVDSILSMKLMLDGKYDHALAKLQGKTTELLRVEGELAKTTFELENGNIKIASLTKENASIKDLRRQLAGIQKQRTDLEKEMVAMKLKYDELDRNNKITLLELTSAKAENQILQGKLAWAKELRAQNIQAQYLKARKTKTSPLANAKKANRIVVDFSVAENPVAEPGKRQVYLVITDAQGNIVGKGNTVFTNPKTQKQQAFSSTKAIDFNSYEQKMKMQVDLTQKLKKGRYSFEIYFDGVQGGKNIVMFDEATGMFSI